MKRNISIWITANIIVLAAALALFLNHEHHADAHESDYIHHVYVPLYLHERDLSPNPFLWQKPAQTSDSDE